MRLLHLIPVIIIIASVTAALKVADAKAFPREFLRASASLLAGFAALSVVIFLLGRAL